MYSQLTPHPSTISVQGLYELLRPVTLEQPSLRARFCNWAGTYHCTPLVVFEPETEYQCELVLELARRENKKVKAVGVGHSPSDIACTKEIMLRTEKLNKVIDINAEKRYVIAQGGITLNKLHHELAKHDLAMICIGSISDQTLAGVVTTASHGSGVHYGVMSTQVMAVTLLLSNGSRVTCSRHNRPELFLATICGLGATGIILSVQMEVEPAFRLKEIHESVPFHVVMDDFDNMAASAQHVRFWWYPSTDTVRCSYSDRTQEPKVSPVSGWLAFLGDPVTQLLLFLGRFLSSLNILAAVLACWLSKNRTVCIDDSYRLFNIDPKYSQFTTEWAIPFENSKACLREIDALLKQDQSDSRGLRPHFPIEIRFTSADDIWLSPSHGQLSCWIGIIQYRPFGFNVAYRKYFQHFEEIMAKYQGRPHWAKSHGLQPHELRRLYPKFDDFVRVIEETDPHGIFRNEYIERHILGRDISRRVFKLRQ